MSDEEIQWPIPIEDLGATLDQVCKGLRDLARPVRSYYEGLIEAGFTEQQALYLAAAWLKPPEPPA